MNATPSPIAEYDNERRSEAAAVGGAIRRTAVPSCAPTPEGRTLFIGRDGRGRPVDARDGGLFSARDLTSWFDQGLRGDPICFVDRGSLRASCRLVRMSGGEGDALARKVEYLCRQEHFGSISVLTTALSRKFWLPAGMDTDDLDAWRSVIRVPSGEDGLNVLLRECQSGAREGESFDRLHNLVIRTDNLISTLGRSLLGKSTSSRVESFTLASRIDDAWASVIALDPLMRDRNLLAGTIAEVTGGSSSSRGLVSVGTPFRLRIGQLVAFDGERSGGVMLSSLTYDGGVLFADMRPPAEKKRALSGNWVIDRQLSSGGRVWITGSAPMPDSRGSRPTRLSKRVGSQSEIRREVPLWVSLAGQAYDA